jgi:hypothetical protein
MREPATDGYSYRDKWFIRADSRTIGPVFGGKRRLSSGRIDRHRRGRTTPPRANRRTPSERRSDRSGSTSPPWTDRSTRLDRANESTRPTKRANDVDNAAAGRVDPVATGRPDQHRFGGGGRHRTPGRRDTASSNGFAGRSSKPRTRTRARVQTGRRPRPQSNAVSKSSGRRRSRITAGSIPGPNR